MDLIAAGSASISALAKASPHRAVEPRKYIHGRDQCRALHKCALATLIITRTICPGRADAWHDLHNENYNVAVASFTPNPMNSAPTPADSAVDKRCRRRKAAASRVPRKISAVR
jgi:hypothetical protein